MTGAESRVSPRLTAVRTENTRIVVDTYAWIEYFRGTRKGEIVKRHLLTAENIYTPSIVLAETARKYIREKTPESNVRQRLNIITEISTITNIDPELAIESGKAYLELLENARRQKLRHKPSLNDAIILATTRKLEAKLITGDQHFKNLQETIWIGE